MTVTDIAQKFLSRRQCTLLPLVTGQGMSTTFTGTSAPDSHAVNTFRSIIENLVANCLLMLRLFVAAGTL